MEVHLAFGWDGAIRLQCSHLARVVAMADVIPGQKTEASAHDVIEVTPWCAACRVNWRQCGNSLALCYFAVVMELPDSLWMNCKSEFGVIFLRCSPT